MNEKIKYVMPIDRLIEFTKQLHDMELKPFGMNYSVRGRFISIYLPIDPMMDFINELAKENLIDYDLRRYYVDQGYSTKDVYFKRFGFDFRIAMHRDKFHNNHDIGWLEDKYVKEIRELKSELKSASILISSLQERISNPT